MGDSEEGRRWLRLQEMFAQALEIEPSHREAYLQATADDSEMLGEVMALLRAHDSGGLLDRISDALSNCASDPAGGTASPGLRSGENDAYPTSFGPYKNIGSIGSGGSAAVFRVQRTDSSRTDTFALKVLHSDELGERFRRRFNVERQILERLVHPNIASIVDSGATSTGVPYIVMEYVPGSPIDTYCDQKGIPLHERVQLICTVCDAVHAAHELGVVHRDLKPSNVLVSNEGTVRLLDFGISKILNADDFTEASRLTRPGEHLLTPDYASPEQLLGRPVTTSSDVYQVGLLLYRLITGELPRLASRVSRAMPADLSVSISPPSKRLSGVGVPRTRRVLKVVRQFVDPVVMRALSEDPRERQGSVHVLSNELERVAIRLKP